MVVTRLRKITLYLWAAMLLMALPPKICAQSILPPLAAAADSLQPAPKVTLLICDPGSEIYELEGHAALRLNFTPAGADDMVVNWGLFDFAAPNFVYRFVKGETDYQAGAIATRHFISSYAAEGRAVREYDLGLTPEQSRRVAQLVAENLRPENRVYRYNYVRDNCSTRPLRITDAARGSELELQPHPVFGTEPTFRQAMRYYHQNYPWYQFGIDLALGSGIDQREPARAMTFAPVALADMLEASGIEPRFLVKASGGGPQGPTPWPLLPLTLGWLVCALGLALSLRDIFAAHRLSRWFDALFFAAVGLAGCLVFFLVFVSVHEATSPNWILLWLNPLALLVPIFIWLKKAKKLLISYQIANFGALFVLLAVWSLGEQSLNPAFLPFILCDMMRSATYLTLNKW